MMKSEKLANYISFLNEQNFSLDYLDKKFNIELHSIPNLTNENIERIKLKKSNDLLKIYLIFMVNHEHYIDGEDEKFIKLAEIDLSTEVCTIANYERYNIYISKLIEDYLETKSSIFEDITTINNKNNLLRKIFKKYYQNKINHYQDTINMLNDIIKNCMEEKSIFNDNTVIKIIKTFIEETNAIFGIQIKVMNDKNSLIEMENKK